MGTFIVALVIIGLVLVGAGWVIDGSNPIITRTGCVERVDGLYQAGVIDDGQMIAWSAECAINPASH